jgi:hypothetical protein
MDRATRPNRCAKPKEIRKSPANMTGFHILEERGNLSLRDRETARVALERAAWVSRRRRAPTPGVSSNSEKSAGSRSAAGARLPCWGAARIIETPG